MRATENRRVLNICLMLKISRYGSGFYMRVPSDIAKALMLGKGDMVELRFLKVVLARSRKGVSD